MSTVFAGNLLDSAGRHRYSSWQTPTFEWSVMKSPIEETGRLNPVRKVPSWTHKNMFLDLESPVTETAPGKGSPCVVPIPPIPYTETRVSWSS